MWWPAVEITDSNLLTEMEKVFRGLLIPALVQLIQ